MKTRELKFRVWDNEEKRFFEPIYEAYKGNLLDLSIDLNGRLMRRTLEMPAEDESRFENRYVINEFTGLKDKNGKNIYEGDILILYAKPVNDCYKFVVEYDEEEAMYVLCDKIEDFNQPIPSFSIERLMIVGNIYENPELLNED